MIRLGPRQGSGLSIGAGAGGAQETRRGFDYAAFEARLESVWFQRKTLLANGRDEDSRAQLEQIRAFCEGEGIQRLESLAGALVAEAYRFHREGNDAHALSALEFAEAFDPGRPQTHVARATVLWRSGGGTLAAAREMLVAVRASSVHALRDLSMLPRGVFVLALACVGAALAFVLLMVLRYQAPMRHEAEECVADLLRPPWPEAAGWLLIALPLLSWFGAGWAALYWLVIAFRFMNRSEKAASAVLLLGAMLSLPVYGVAVGFYGTSANPAVRTTVNAVGGEYDPDRIVRIRELVEVHPDDPVYRFLLAGLYKNGRYFEEAFDEYKAVLDLEPAFVPAHINVGNLFYTTGQYAAAINSYRSALTYEPESFLAHFNLHLAQSEDFHFKEAEESLQQARKIDADRVGALLAKSNDYDDRTAVEDATLDMLSVWQAAVAGRSLAEGATRPAGVGSLFAASEFVNLVAVVCVVSLALCLVLGLVSRRAHLARRCIRCGRPFCHRCKRQRDAQEYCGQCLHLYVLRDGLAPETKAKKLFEVEQYERRTRLTRRLAAFVLPGAGHVLRGRTAVGLTLLVAWFAVLVGAWPELFALEGGGMRLAADLLLPSDVPMIFEAHPGRYVAFVLIPIVWLVGNWRVWRPRES